MMTASASMLHPTMYTMHYYTRTAKRSGTATGQQRPAPHNTTLYHTPISSSSSCSFLSSLIMHLLVLPWCSRNYIIHTLACMAPPSYHSYMLPPYHIVPYHNAANDCAILSTNLASKSSQPRRKRSNAGIHDRTWPAR